MSARTEALRLADALDCVTDDNCGYCMPCSVADELRRLHQHELANEAWNDKTNWVQETARPGELGMHRADAMRARLIEAESQRDVLLEALRDIAKFSGEKAARERARGAIAKTEGQS